MAYAAHNILKDECGDPGLLCDRMRPTPPGSKLLKYIRNVSFVGLQGTDVRFNEDGDAYGSYSIFQYQKGEDDKYDYVMVGSWKEKLEFEVSKTRWNSENSTVPPKSICSGPCPLGHIRNFQVSFLGFSFFSGRTR
ncbi:hypothetical protein RUM43_011855 [Polyplax serrata]|uniref:Receptor ligand binding region domain-containing protein n=1 Tax=Polyplax serrata TaxID=468196 RepID=A0AAN8S6M5_POLSC